MENGERPGRARLLTGVGLVVVGLLTVGPSGGPPWRAGTAPVARAAEAAGGACPSIEERACAVPAPGGAPVRAGPHAVGPGAGTPAPGATYAWPLLPPPAVLTPFRAPTHAYGPGHRGVDLAGQPDQPVLAARAGTVVFAGPVAGHGVVSVQHDDGLRTTYEPVSPTVAAGTVVRAGDVLGRLEAGHGGCPGAAACLHWGVRRDRLDYLDPLVLLGPTRVRLLPVPEPWPDGDPPAPEPPPA